MFVYVQFLSGFTRQFIYKVPQALESGISKGIIVIVPLKDKFVGAIVSRIVMDMNEEVSYAIKEITRLEPMPEDIHYQKFVQTISSYAFVSPIHFTHSIKSFLNEQKDGDEVTKKILDYNFDNAPLVELTDEQKIIVDYCAPFVKNSLYAPTVIHGVTGSGKTEVYKKLIEQAICLGKSVIMMLPEVSLAIQFEHRLKKQMPGVQVFGFHSATTIPLKRELWHSLLEKIPVLIIGVHLPILLPIYNLGLIIVDEEHEQGFIEKKYPKLNSKELALWRAKIYNIPIILGSATPSIATLYQVKNNGWKLFQITKRFAGRFPEVKKILLTEHDRRRKHFWISKDLEQAVAKNLANKEQCIIYINRRGFSFFVQCKICGFIFQCNRCSVSLTLHILPSVVGQTKVGLLCCHYCDYKIAQPKNCSCCGAGSSDLLKKGIGTQQVVEIFKELFPFARVARADLDSTSKKRDWHKTVEQFEQGELDILIGTKSITKGYHFPKVTLVGILWADLNLNFPSYNAAETTLQQIIQVAGRAGREHEKSLVIVQALHDHQIFNFINEERYLDFCGEELEMRKEANYPPVSRLACIELRSNDENQLEHDAQALCTWLIGANNKSETGVIILGPSIPVVYKIQDVQMRHIVLKAEKFQSLHRLLSQIDRSLYKSEILIVTSGAA